MQNIHKKIVVILMMVAGCFMAGSCKSSPTPKGPGSAEIPEMVLIKAGKFTMGSPVDEQNRLSDEVEHEVSLAGFYMGKYEITQKLWEEVMGSNPSFFIGDDLPVEHISWYDSLVFCNTLSIKNGFEPAYSIGGSTHPDDWGLVPVFSPDQGNDLKWDSVEIVDGANGYRLPTEAQWEYACRAGSKTPFNTGGDILDSQANYDGRFPYKGDAVGTFREKTTPVGSFKPNAWGLYDMHGNVWEWCWNWRGNYTGTAVTDPEGVPSGTYRVARGGSWVNNGRSLRSAFRGDSAPSFRENHLGLRIVRPL